MSNCTCLDSGPPVKAPGDIEIFCWPAVPTNRHARTSAMLAHAATWPVDEDGPSQWVFQCRDGRTLPRFMNQSSNQNVGLPDGLYLGLFNGRNDPLGSPLVAGFDGPLIGRLRTCHTIKARDIELEFLDPFEGRLFFPDMAHVAGPDGLIPTRNMTMPVQLMLNSGAIVFDGRYFADWTVFIISPVHSPNHSPIGHNLRALERE
ncbi:hypothetical protein [Burkholderia multivorans]|uniref:hypothetical protein n=1 Tax=Burkholderia multivorans TaxID=87883 RepID=UPI001C22C0E7|nr:hypothetical protein [Burkholderia multivorans]MBU9477998.1 hypothetical protein [Burkholderia multivorans]